MKPQTLLRFYPRAWRSRYGDEFLALLEREGVPPRVALNVLMGALDAWLSPSRWLRDPVAAHAYTLRVWRIPLPVEDRGWRDTVRQLILLMATALVLRAFLELGMDLAAGRRPGELLRLVPVALSATVWGVSRWCAGYSIRTKLVASSVLFSLAYALLYLTGLWA